MRIPRWGLLVGVIAGVPACADRDVAAPESVAGSDLQVLAALAEAGYRGPVVISEWTAIDEDGRRSGRTVLVPDAERVAAALDADPRAAAALRAALTVQQEVTDPEAVDSDHNSPLGAISGRVSPSRLNGPNPIQSRIDFTNRFIGFDFATGQAYIVQEAEILESRVVARDSSGGHWHGASSDFDTRRRLLSLPQRVGRLEPTTGHMTGGTWSNTWFAPEFAQEVNFEYVLREIGGPNDGQEGTFTSILPSATRQSGFVRLPPNDAHYVRTGGTDSHPEAFNDWGEADIIRRIQNFAREYHEKTGDRTSVNDIALFFGGRFDVGRIVNRVLVACSNANEAVCWGFSHEEHRGSEADIRPIDRSSVTRIRTFNVLIRRHFPSVYPEGSHWHVRDALSPYGG